MFINLEHCNMEARVGRGRGQRYYRGSVWRGMGDMDGHGQRGATEGHGGGAGKNGGKQRRC